MHYLSRDHRHDGEADGPGAFHERHAPLPRDYRSRAFTIGIGGPVGSGKTALLLALCRMLRDEYNLAVVTNDIFTREDGEFLVRHEFQRARGIERGVARRGDDGADRGDVEHVHALSRH